MRHNQANRGIESTLRYSNNRVSQHLNQDSNYSALEVPRAASLQEHESDRITQKISLYESNDQNNQSSLRYQAIYKPMRRYIKPEKVQQECADQKQFWQLLERVNSQHQPTEVEQNTQNIQSQETEKQIVPTGQFHYEDEDQWSFDHKTSKPENSAAQHQENKANQNVPNGISIYERTGKKKSTMGNRSRVKSKSRPIFEKIEVKRNPQGRREGEARKKQERRRVSRMKLVLIKFPEKEVVQEDRRYPIRQTRIKPLRYWQSEHVDLQQKGIWVRNDYYESKI